MSAPAELPLERARISPREWLALGLILLVATAMRLYQLDLSLWLDEVFTIMLAAGHGVGFKEIPVGTLLPHGPDLTGFGDVPIHQIPFRLKGDVHPPLVYLLLHLWIQVGGKGDFWVRLFPVVFSVASAFVLFLGARRTVGGVLALGVTLVAAVSVFEIYYAQEVRSYTLLQLMMVGAILAALRAAERPSAGRLATWSVLLLGMCLTHYFALGAAAGLGMWLLLAVPKRARLRVVIAGAAAAGAFGILWGPFLLQQGGGGLSGDHMAAEEHVTVAEVLARAATYFPRVLLTRLPQTGVPVVLIGTALLILVPALALRVPALALRVPSRGPTTPKDGPAPAGDGRSPRASPVLAWWASLLGALMMLVVLDLAKNTITLRFPRYNFHVAPAVYVCVAWLPIPLTRQLALRLVPVTIACAFAIFGTIRYGYFPKGLWSNLAVWVEQNANDQDALLFVSDRKNDWRPGANYMCLSHYSEKSRHLPLLLVDATHPPPPEALRELASRRLLFLVSSLPANHPIELPGFDPINVADWPFPTGDAPQSVWVFVPRAPAPSTSPSSPASSTAPSKPSGPNPVPATPPG